MNRRAALIARLVQLDPNGTWTDADSLAEGMEPLTEAEAAAAVERLS